MALALQKPRLPENGQVIVFTAVAPNSYAVVGVPYQVIRAPMGGDIFLRNLNTGSATFDRPSTIARSTWAVA